MKIKACILALIGRRRFLAFECMKFIVEKDRLEGTELAIMQKTLRASVANGDPMASR